MQLTLSTNAGLVKKQTNIKYIEYTLVAALIFFEALLLQWISGALNNEFTVFPDEAAHYVSSLMVHDYILEGDLSNPMSYAENYYIHYPKVAIGHWPPVLYGALGIWFIIFGVSRISAMCFMAAVAAVSATVIYGIAKATLGRYAGIFSALLFIALPITQMSTGAVMLEHLVTMLTLISVVFLGRFLSTAEFKYGLLFSLFAAAAILTRGSAWSIGLMPLLAMFFAWDFSMLKRPVLWLSAIPVLVLCAPWYLLMPSVNTGAFQSDSIFDLSFTQAAIPYFTSEIYLALGVVLFVLFVLGVWSKLISPRIRGEKVDTLWAALAAMFLATLIIHDIVPASFEPRYMLTVMPEAVIFAAAGIEWVINWLKSVETKRVLQPVFYLVVAGLFMVTNFEVTSIDNRGYLAAYNATVQHLGTNKVNILVASGVFGEGSVVAEAARDNRKHDSVILRGSKLLVNEDWQGRNSEDKFHNPEELKLLLDELSVDAVILDTAVVKERRRNYHDLLESTLADSNSGWNLARRLDVSKNGTLYKFALQVYVSDKAKQRLYSDDIDLDYVKSLYDGN